MLMTGADIHWLEVPEAEYRHAWKRNLDPNFSLVGVWTSNLLLRSPATARPPRTP